MKKMYFLFMFNIFISFQIYCVDHEDRLINAAYAGDLKTVQEIISNRLASPNIKGPMGTPLLMFAMASGNEELVEYLLDNGADAAVKDAEGRKASTRAAANNLSKKLIDRLLDLENAKVETEREPVKTMFERLFEKDPFIIEAKAHTSAPTDNVVELKWNEECFKPDLSLMYGNVSVGEKSYILKGTNSSSNLSHIKRPQPFCKTDFILDEVNIDDPNFIIVSAIERYDVKGLINYLKDKELSDDEVTKYLRFIKNKCERLEEFSKALELDPDGKPERWMINSKLHALREIRNIIESKKKK